MDDLPGSESGSEYQDDSSLQQSDNESTRSDLASDPVSEYEDDPASEVSDEEMVDVSDNGPEPELPGLQDLEPPQRESEVTEIEAEIQQIDASLRSPQTLDKDAYDEDDLFHGNLHPPEFYREGIQVLNEDDFARKQYKPSTMYAINACERQWKQFCETILQQKDWKGCLRRIDFAVLQHFLKWHLNQRTGKNGQKKATNQGQNVIDRLLALARLGRRLKHNLRENRPMTTDDLRRQIETTLRTTEKAFKLGEIRVLAVLYLLMLAPAGSRPGAILALKFKHLEVLLVRSPADPDGQLLVVIRMSLEHTKEYMGQKATNHFVFTEDLGDSSLFLSPHVFLLAILFRHKAFKSASLNESPHTLGSLRVADGERRTKLALRPDFAEKFVFRKAVQTAAGFEVGEDPIAGTMVAKIVSKIGLLAGFQNSTISYSLRYIAGNNLDQHVDVSNSLRNLVMGHAPNSSVFQAHYLGRNVPIDVLAIARNLEPQKQLMQQLSSHGHSVSKRRPTKLTKEQVDSLKDDPDFPMRSKKYREIASKCKSCLDRLRRLKLAEVREQWDNDQGVEDIERQLQGKGSAPKTADPGSTVNPEPDLHANPVQQKMLEALAVPPVKELQAQLLRRADAIAAIVAYCQEEDSSNTKVLDARRPPRPSELSLPFAPKESITLIKNSMLVSMAGSSGVLRCYICVAKAERLGPNHGMFDVLCRVFSHKYKLAYHFTHTHLSCLQPKDIFECPICKAFSFKSQ
ncbi:hypothetical protein M406DRAFT_71451 [Cryphonectria parasitica EP155]|uniref:C2H2-type domain-containing protein n=1 Tax=Cryphonectria parasitica (strain ATCC 38755 / EP155) TaxID=660469 RepID=A0A9P4Y8F3_CRYP1|nr:uncharacterized protein M406DRAFT_71451 [Cryphonectria parasitica EP155]KAF3768443.1 hypothetical protein M406DRAFT_71451 [Cryphonectria parasitica EP155]